MKGSGAALSSTGAMAAIGRSNSTGTVSPQASRKVDGLKQSKRRDSPLLSRKKGKGKEKEKSSGKNGAGKNGGGAEKGGGESGEVGGGGEGGGGGGAVEGERQGGEGEGQEGGKKSPENVELAQTVVDEGVK